MLIFAIDDEKIALLELCETIQKALVNAEIESFTNPNRAIERIRTEKARPDVVFSDIRMPGMNGLELAMRIKTHSPDTKIIFVTGYSEYAVPAFRVHANGYLLKPVLPNQIKEEIEYLDLPCKPAPEKLNITCFGSFEVFYKGVPVSFKRRQTKELLAILVDHNGAFCLAEEAAALLWEDEPNLTKAKHRLRNLVSDMRTALKEIGQEDILLRESGKLAIRREAVDCDYFRMLDGDITAVNAYRGEYMKQYIWAQYTEEKLHFGGNPI